MQSLQDGNASDTDTTQGSERACSPEWFVGANDDYVAPRGGSSSHVSASMKMNFPTQRTKVQEVRRGSAEAPASHEGQHATLEWRNADTAINSPAPARATMPASSANSQQPTEQGA